MLDDDTGTDGTPDLLPRLFDQRLVGRLREDNQGKGAAWQDGVDAIWILTGNARGQGAGRAAIRGSWTSAPMP